MTKPDLPPFVVDGQYEDDEWRANASTPATQRTKAQERFMQQNPHPRPHPYSSTAYRDVKDDGTVRYFPSREARDEYVNTHELNEEARRRPPGPAASEGNALQHQAESKSREEVMESTKAGKGGKRPVGG